MLEIERERRQRSMSRRELGRMLGITEEAVRLLESGKRKPSYKVLVKLEDLFEMGHRELFAQSDAPEQSTQLQDS